MRVLSNTIKGREVVLGVVAVCLFLVIPCQAGIIYVDTDANGANDGSSWANAYNYLQDALADANSNVDVNEIWVAQGIYTPDSNSGDPNGSGDRTATFQLPNGVALYGGFPSYGDPNWEDRDPNTYETILSGDIDGNDVDVNDPCDLLSEPTRAENSYHVVTGSGTDETAVLNGFTIIAGVANGSSWDGSGGGMQNLYGSSPTVANCTFIGNSARYDGGGMKNFYNSLTLANCTFTGNSARYAGGGIDNFNSSLNLTNCTFNGNWASYGGGMHSWESSLALTNCAFSGNKTNTGGAGIFNYYNSVATLTDCTFNENRSNDGGGGGMFNDSSSQTLTNCTFIGNSARYAGGGLENQTECTSIITNCIFIGNSAEMYGGGMFNGNWNNIVLANCTFIGNSAEMYGGGMSNDFENNLTLANCTFSENWAETSGGGISNWGSNLTLTNCTFSGNSTDGSGGGMENGWSAPTLNNCTFSGNWANVWGGGMYNGYDSDPNIANCILWGNAAGTNGAEIALIGLNSTVTVLYSDAQGGLSSVYIDPNCSVIWGLGNIDADPCFVESGYWADANDPNIIVEPNDPNAIWVDGDYHLLPSSPCIDAGDNTAVPSDVTDLDGDGNTIEPIPWDLDGNPRIVDGDKDSNSVVDMGAYEAALIDPTQFLDILTQDVIDIGLHQGIENSLLVKLDTALQKLEDDNENNDVAAVNLLQAFINAVEAQHGKKIPVAEADALIATAQEIIDLLSGE